MRKLPGFKIFRLVLIAIIVLSTAGFAYSEVSASGEGFSDINGHWAAGNIDRLIDIGSINGYPDGTFKPGNSISRAEFTKVLVTSLGEGPKDGNAYTDTGDHWSVGYVKAALELGIIELPDYYNNRFQPDINITRGEIAKMVVLGMGLKSSALDMDGSDIGFSDKGDVPAKLAGYVAAATNEGIIQGYPDDTFRHDGQATRAEAVTMVVRMLDWLDENNGGSGNEDGNNDEDPGTGEKIDLDNIVESPLGDDGKRYGSDLKVIDKPFMIEILQGKLWHDGDTDENGNVIDIGYNYGYNTRAKYLMMEFRVTNITKETRDFRPIFWVWATFGVKTRIGEPGKVYTIAPDGVDYINPAEELTSTTLKPGESYTGKMVFQFMAEEVTSAIFQADYGSHSTDDFMDCFIPLPEEWWKD